MHRLPGGSVGGLWEFPGGKVEPGESLIQALKREWLEETGLQIEVGDQLAQVQFIHKDNPVDLVAHQVIIDEKATPQLIEHDDYCWVEIEQIGSMELVDSDRMLLPQLFPHHYSS
ncbi:MAG: NUDIX domain-containing protein [Spirochaetales bacterium]|nr:NUDIX domain-containing protein [Spirochaetales bacterium]